MTREEAIEFIAQSVKSGVDMAKVADAIKALEQEPKTGHWIKYGIPRCGEQHYKCTACDEYFNFGLYSDYYKKAFKYCPNCGARMVQPQESEETETWNGIHAQITAPKGTFDRIFNEAVDDTDI